MATGASLLLPGTGQLLLGQRRWALYAVLEAAGWLVHLDRRREGRRLRGAYRDLAWETARAAGPEPRRDGDWSYYERMEAWPASGRWDADPVRQGTQPETDPATFNGSVWQLARDLYAPGDADEGSPAWNRALIYYEAKATPADQLWNWVGKEESRVQYVEMIDRSDEALRTATVVLGAVVANHLLSAADAFVSTRRGGSAVSASAGLATLGGEPVLEWRLDVRP